MLIRQVYWRLGDGWRLRLRRLGEDPGTEDWLAFKGPRRGTDRWEFEYQMSSVDMSAEERADTLDAALILYRAGAAHSVVKVRHSHLLDGRTWDVDEFLWENEGLFIAEVEAHDQTELMSVTKPAWAVREITTQARYNNENLAFEPYSTWK